MSLMSQILHAAIRIVRPLPSTHWSVKRQRRQMNLLARLVRVPPGVEAAPVNAGGVKATWMIPREHHPERVILYLHGGAYMSGSPYTHREITGLLARYSRLRLLSLDYRLAPEHPFPAALDDARAGYTWLLEKGFQPWQIALAGDSAGGGLCVALLLALRDANQDLPAAAALISPWADLEGTGESTRTRVGIDPLFSPSDLPRAAAHYLNGRNPRHPLISPVYTSLDELPPMLIQVGDREILLSDSTRLYHNLRKAGGEGELSVWPGLWHVFQAMGERMPESKRALREMAAFLSATLENARQRVQI
jgi:epsilon-lactone hydrolase